MKCSIYKGLVIIESNPKMTDISKVNNLADKIVFDGEFDVSFVEEIDDNLEYAITLSYNSNIHTVVELTAYYNKCKENLK